MKYIAAIIKPSKLNTIREVLMTIGVEGLTPSSVSRFGQQKGRAEIYRGAEYAPASVAKRPYKIMLNHGHL